MSELFQQELGGWILEAHDHWQEHRPKMYRESLKAGKLPSALKTAAQRTAHEMDQLMEAGYTHHQAWEAVRQTYLFLPEEEGVTEEPEPDPFWELHKEMMELQREIYQAEADLKGWA